MGPSVIYCLKTIEVVHTGANPSEIQIAHICQIYLTTIHLFVLLLTKIQKKSGISGKYSVRVKNPDPDSGNFLAPNSDFKGGL